MNVLGQRRGELRGHVLEALGSLGSDADEVARRLAELGVQGTPGSPDDCALAVYLAAILGADPRIGRVKVTSTRAVFASARWWQLSLAVGLPESLCTFIGIFDHRGFPELVRPTRRAAIALVSPILSPCSSSAGAVAAEPSPAALPNDHQEGDRPNVPAAHPPY